MTPVQTSDWAQPAEACRPLFGEWLARLVAIPTVSMLPQHRPDIRRCAHEVGVLIQELGGQFQLLESAAPGGHPIAIGRFGSNPAHPTLLVYDHLDVQPVPDEADWTTPPFTCVRQGDHYLGRGTTDAKGPVLATLLAARLARSAGVPLNLCFVLDSELEIGSLSFDATIEHYRDQLACSSIICPDTIWTSREQPALSGGVRGVVSFVVRLRTADRIAHAGWAGGYARNPLAEVVSVLAECVDGRTGEVKIPGFYADMLPIRAVELAGFGRCGFDAQTFHREHGLRTARPGTDTPLEATRRMWALPTLELHGIVGGHQGPGNRMIIPDAVEARLSCRLVPGMLPSRTFALVRDFILARLPDAEVDFGRGIDPLVAEVEGPLAEAALAAMELGFGRAPVWVREGVTIPALVSLTHHLRAPIVLLPLSLSDQSYHGPNERFEWFQARGGIVAYAEYFRRLAELGGAMDGNSP